ncbi:MAG TPA: tRNA (N6-threonylcarbamoyladenosine(37)-N6)-methyltransferase TrmO [Acetobacteraceae bacterium]|nr:tRNA (N6-threonylcarbamoyladenosine(37)-N6)-methyltransferase TrmO [Acetobacteraceae bacterium]
MTLTVRPIGTLATPWKTVAACPRNGRQPNPAPVCRAVVDDVFVPGLASLDGFSHLILLYWMDQPATKEQGLVFTPPFDAAPRGIFATRAPWRPNPIALSVVAFDGFDAAGILRVRYLDCVDGTPLLDIKPYLPTTDAEPAARMGWLQKHATRRTPCPT